MARVAVFGFALSGWLNHYWIAALERVAPGASLRATGVKMVLDQTIFAPTILTLFFGSLSLMEGKTLEQTRALLDKLLWPVASSWPVPLLSR